MPERPRFARAGPMPAASPRSILEVEPPHGRPENQLLNSASFGALLGKLSDAYACVELDNRRLLSALQASQGLASAEGAVQAPPFGHVTPALDVVPLQGAPQERAPVYFVDTNGVSMESTGFTPLQGPPLHVSEGMGSSLYLSEMSGAPARTISRQQHQQRVSFSEGDGLQQVMPMYDRDHRLLEAARTFDSEGMAPRSHSEVHRDAVIQEHQLRRKFTKITERSKLKRRSMFTEIDVMIAERQLLSPRGLRYSKLVTCEEAMGAMNAAVGRVSQSDVFSFEEFKDLVMRDNLEETVGPDVVDFALAARHAFEREELTKMVAKFSHVGTKDLKSADTSVVTLGIFMDPLSFLLIISNSIVLAVSTDVDPDWMGWDYIELGFTSFFVCELTLKMFVHGACDFFLGADRGWNIADFIFVAFAVIDAFLLQVAQVGESDFQMFTLMRLVRLCRITRLVRLLRFKIFKELLLMIQGIVAGLRTLFWAIILLMSVIFCLGMLMRQTIGRWCEHGRSEMCRHDHLARYGRELLGTVPRACFTVFRSFTEGCASSDGTPLLVHIYENSWYGALMVAIYVLIFLAVTFGLFNLIMAVFVENTMESAKLDERKRRQMRHRESLIIARKLQRIVVRFSQTGDGSKPNAFSSGKSSCEGGRSSLNSLLWFRKGNNEETGVGAMGVRSTDLSVQITRDMFRNAVSDPSMEALLEDLEVNVSDPMTLFDTLDADDSGSLDVSELIQGIIKLRGTADKSDVIASLLSIRSMQKSLRKFEFKTLQGQKRLDLKLAALEQHARQPPCSESARASVLDPP